MSGGDVIKTEDCGTGFKLCVSKIYTGVADTSGGPVTGTNPFNVTMSEATITIGQVTVTTGAAHISGGSLALYQGLQVKALDTNSSPIYIGTSSGVTSSNGFPLQAGQGVFVPCQNMNVLFVVTSSGSQGLAYIGF